MKKITILAVVMTLSIIMSGCSKTWSGVKEDTSKAWNTSKKAVHEATA
jgi:predicted small secreted protein